MASCNCKTTGMYDSRMTECNYLSILLKFSFCIGHYLQKCTVLCNIILALVRYGFTYAHILQTKSIKSILLCIEGKTGKWTTELVKDTHSSSFFSLNLYTNLCLNLYLNSYKPFFTHTEQEPMSKNWAFYFIFIHIHYLVSYFHCAADSSPKQQTAASAFHLLCIYNNICNI